MPSLNLGERVAHRPEEVVVGRPDRPVHRELDHGLRLADGRDLSGEVGVLYRRRTGPIATTFIGLYVLVAVLIAVFTSGS